MRLYWIRVFEKEGPGTLQEYFIEKNRGYRLKGVKAVFCKDCQRWVTSHDWECYCQYGMHEFSIAVELDHEITPDTDSK